MNTTHMPPPSQIRHERDIAYRALIAKSRRNIADLAKQPATWSFDPRGDYSMWPEGFYEIGNWTTSFHTGMALIAWNETEDEHFISNVLALEPFYQNKLTGDNAVNTMHDLGFLYSLYSVALYKITGEETHRQLAIKAAEVLAHRFYPNGNFIRAWGRLDEIGTDWDEMAIIDCMMNLPLLYWASEQTGNERFKEIAIKHSDTTIANFVRADDSVCHAFRFGTRHGEENYCGFNVDSHWARGNAWAIYGFAMGYRYTQNERYLETSQRVLKKFLSLLDDEMVPMWDFRLSNDSQLQIRDSSAAAIAVCGIQELEGLGHADASMTAWKNALIERLCSTNYLNTDPEVRGTLKHGQVGMGVKSYTSWGDYYLMEALARENGMPINWW